MFVSICIATYKRPERLRSLLEGLNSLVFEEVEAPEIEVLVVDNDVSGVAQSVAEQIKPEFRWKIKTDCEKNRGITYARNKTVTMVSPRADFIAIIDDDEVPQPSWLEELLLVQQHYGSDIVTGPVIPVFDSVQVPFWIKAGGFFQPPRFETGESRTVAFTNNVLVKAEILRNMHPPFDNRFALSGGSDCCLFLNLKKAGHSITWADEAIVYDYINPSRTNLKWILFRGYREWSNHSSIERELYPSLMVQSIRAVKGLGLITIGLVRFVPSLFFGKAAAVSSLLYVARGMGTFGGLIGLFYEEYKNISSLTLAEE